MVQPWFKNRCSVPHTPRGDWRSQVYSSSPRRIYLTGLKVYIWAKSCFHLWINPGEVQWNPLWPQIKLGSVYGIKVDPQTESMQDAVRVGANNTWCNEILPVVRTYRGAPVLWGCACMFSGRVRPPCLLWHVVLGAAMIHEAWQWYGQRSQWLFSRHVHLGSMVASVTGGAGATDLPTSHSGVGGSAAAAAPLVEFLLCIFKIPLSCPIHLPLTIHFNTLRTTLPMLTDLSHKFDLFSV